MNLRDMLAASLAAKDAGDDKPWTGPRAEAAVMDLRAACARYLAPCPFAPGDLVTPRRGYSSRWNGHPGVVLEVVAPDRGRPVAGAAIPGSVAEGRRADMRVLQFDSDGEMGAFWVESFEFERYVVPAP